MEELVYFRFDCDDVDQYVEATPDIALELLEEHGEDVFEYLRQKVRWGLAKQQLGLPEADDDIYVTFLEDGEYDGLPGEWEEE